MIVYDRLWAKMKERNISQYKLIKEYQPDGLYSNNQRYKRFPIHRDTGFRAVRHGSDGDGEAEGRVRQVIGVTARY